MQGCEPVTGKMPVPQVLPLKWKHYSNSIGDVNAGIRARHRQDACATSFTSDMETLYKTKHIQNPTYTKPNLFVGFRDDQPNLQKWLKNPV
jgi:hypothetical protein